MSAAEADEIEALRADNQRLRQELAAVEIRFGLVLEATNDGVWDWDLETNETLFSRRWKSILGYEEDEIASSAQAFFDLVDDQDKARVEAAVAAHLERREPYIIEFRMRAKDGSWRTIEARGQAMWDEAGKPLRIAGIHTDVTERRQQERERLQAETMLQSQSLTIRTLGVPILQVWKGISCLPIMGEVDRDRADDMTSALLDRVATTNTRFAILDLTGADFQSETVQYLARMTMALRLIGAQGVFCGVSPRTARVLVEAELDLGEVPTYRDLGAALRACLLRLDG